MSDMKCVDYKDLVNKYGGPPFCPTERYAALVACCPLVSHSEYADETNRQTDRQTPNCYITLSLDVNCVTIQQQLWHGCSDAIYSLLTG